MLISIRLVKNRNELEENVVGKKFSKSNPINFFFTDATTFSIVIIIMKAHYQNLDINLEFLYQEITSCSRPKINKIINDAYAFNFIDKVKDKRDKRKIFIVPSNKTKESFENLINKFNFS